MTDYVTRAGLDVDPALARFLEDEVLAPIDVPIDAFWDGFAALCHRFVPLNRNLIQIRSALQASIDTWHEERSAHRFDAIDYRRFLEEIGYLVPEPAPFEVSTRNVDAEIARMAGPQLVVPILNARFLLNAANARWGSLYDAFYGTDALDAPPARAGAYDAARGDAVVARVRKFLDETFPLNGTDWSSLDTMDDLPLVDPAQLVGRTRRGPLLRNHGLHVEIVVDPADPIGAQDQLGISDVVLESALTTIADCEDSVAAVDAQDKLLAYRNWLGIMRGDLSEQFVKNGKTQTRSLAGDIEYTDAAGNERTLPGRSLMFVRNVGHLMTTPALRWQGEDIPEGILDAVVTSAIGAHDVRGLGRFGNSREGSIYIVKPKMHGPDECAFTDDLFKAVEDLLGLDRHTIKVGVMDEERRTSANLAACIHAVRERIVFINTGFLDRTGDEIHTSMRAGAMMRKGAMKESVWLNAYEARNVGIGLACGLSGRAQIGKGMWAAPDLMGQMLQDKIGHLRAGANTAWVPSPTAATLHALHYHKEDVFALQDELPSMPGLDALLTIPLAKDAVWSPEEIAAELDNNCQGLLGYVVRWIDQGVGCSKVPDIEDIGLMEDRATLRISSQHVANWLMHGIVTEEQVMDTLRRMAAKVDAQNAGDPDYTPLLDNEDGAAFSAAKDLIFKGAEQPSGYTEPLLHAWRLERKALCPSG